MTAQAQIIRPDLDEIRARLHAADVLRHYGVEVKEPPRGDWFGHECPHAYHRKSERALVINPQSGLWQCYAGCAGRHDKPLGGDLFTFIAEREGLSLTGEDFAKVAVIAADLAGVVGVEMSPEERIRRWQTHRNTIERHQREQAEQRRRHRADSIVKATAYWNALATRSTPGEAYLVDRGIGDAVERGIVRFDRADHDSIALALHTSDGRIANVIRRRLPAYAPTPDDRFRPLAGLWARGSSRGRWRGVSHGNVTAWRRRTL